MMAYNSQLVLRLLGYKFTSILKEDTSVRSGINVYHLLFSNSRTLHDIQHFTLDKLY